MDLSMDIAAMSMSLASSQLQMNIGLAMAKKTMETGEEMAEGLYQMMDAAAQTVSNGHIIDVKA